MSPLEIEFTIMELSVAPEILIFTAWVQPATIIGLSITKYTGMPAMGSSSTQAMPRMLEACTISMSDEMIPGGINKQVFGLNSVRTLSFHKINRMDIDHRILLLAKAWVSNTVQSGCGFYSTKFITTPKASSSRATGGQAAMAMARMLILSAMLFAT